MTRNERSDVAPAVDRPPIPGVSPWLRALPAIALYIVFCTGSYVARAEFGAARWVRAPGHLLYDFYYAAALLCLYIVAVPFLYAIARVRPRLFRTSAPHPRAIRWVDFRARFISRHRILRAVVAVFAVSFFTDCYSRFKTLIPLLGGFRFDDALAHWDQVLHFGMHPFQLTGTLLSPTLLPLVDDFYHVSWPILTFFVFPVALAWTADGLLLRKYALAHILTWILLGLGLGILIPAAGPIFFDRVALGVDPYAPLQSALDFVAAHQYLRVVDIRDYLWQAYSTEAQGIGTGILAMPSLHVAMPVLWALAFWRSHRRLAYFCVTYTFATLAASVALGWHYALDGYVAIIGVPLVWWLAGRLLGAWDVHLERRNRALDPISADVSTRPLPVAVLATSTAALLLTEFWRYRFFYHDDAFISLRYVRNFLGGFGLVWNPSEYVEGYSNLLFVLLLGAAGWLGVDLIAASRAIGIVSLLALAAILFTMTWRLCDAARVRAYSAVLAVTMLVSVHSMAIWSLSGMETLLFTALIIAGTFTLLAGRGSEILRGTTSAVFMSLATYTRPEGALFALSGTAYLLLDVRRRPSAARELRAYLLTGAAFAACLIAWRIAYYGDWLPNTAYVKVTPSLASLWQGFLYILAFALQPPFLLPVAIGGAALLLRERTPPNDLYLVGVLAVYLIFVLLVGGDHMPAWRFMVPLTPFLVLIALRAALRTPSLLHGKRPLFMALIVIAAATMPFIAAPREVARAITNDPAAAYGALVGDYIAHHFDEDATIALHTAGSTPFFAPEHKFIDMLGLTDRYIARQEEKPIRAPWQRWPGHAKGDGAYILARSPHYVILGTATGTLLGDPRFITDIELDQLTDFARMYTPQCVAIGWGSGVQTRVVSPQADQEVITFIYYARLDVPLLPASNQHACFERHYRDYVRPPIRNVLF